jgi:ankyrin repeat protein
MSENNNTKRNKKLKQRSAAAMAKRAAKWSTQKIEKRSLALEKQKEKKENATRKQESVLRMFPEIMSLTAAEGYLPNINSVKFTSRTMRNNLRSVPLFKNAEKSTIYPNGKTMLGSYLEMQQWDRASALINSGVPKKILNNPIFGTIPPLVFAYQQNRLDIFRQLLEKGADPNIVNPTGGDSLFIHLVKDFPIDPNYRVQFLNELLRHKVDINQMTKNGYTPLDLAILLGDEVVFNFLLDQGADPEKANKNGFTPLLTAISKNKLDLLLIILNEKDVNLDKQTGDKMLSPLKIAVLNGKTEAVEILLEKGIKHIDAKDAKGNTALHYAVMTRSKDKVKLLMDAGANPRLSNKKNVSPMDIAQGFADAGDSKILALLQA